MARSWSEPNESGRYMSSRKYDNEAGYDSGGSYKEVCECKKHKPISKNCECECVAGIEERLRAAEFQGVTVFLNVKSLGVLAGTVLAVADGVVKFTIVAFVPVGSVTLVAVPGITATLSICDINAVGPTTGITLP